MNQSIYVIRTFVRRGKVIGVLPPTICFERDLALDMAETDEAEAEGVAVYELDGQTNEAKPFAAFGSIPGEYWKIGRTALLAAAPPAEVISLR
jgi:hypothetical protein